MFFQKELDHIISIHPQYLGRRLKDRVKAQLRDMVEGCLLGNLGFVILVLDINDNIGIGLIDNDTGYSKFKIRFTALLYRPFKNEVLDCCVSSVGSEGVFCKFGPIDNIFISKSCFLEDYMNSFDPETSCYKNADNEVIKVDTHLRVRIIGVNIHNTKIGITATIRGDYLGPESNNQM
ncbi:hypothetical protein WA158_006108 [Blastocystis sp. Blastoise]